MRDIAIDDRFRAELCPKSDSGKHYFDYTVAGSGTERIFCVHCGAGASLLPDAQGA